MEPLIAVASQFGIVGLVSLAAGWYVYRHDEQSNAAHKEMQDRHTEERKEWTVLLATQHSEAIASQRESSNAMTKVATAIADLSTLIRDRK